MGGCGEMTSYYIGLRILVVHYSPLVLFSLVLFLE